MENVSVSNYIKCYLLLSTLHNDINIFLPENLVCDFYGQIRNWVLIITSSKKFDNYSIIVAKSYHYTNICFYYMTVVADYTYCTRNQAAINLKILICFVTCRTKPSLMKDRHIIYKVHYLLLYVQTTVFCWWNIKLDTNQDDF